MQPVHQRRPDPPRPCNQTQLLAALVSCTLLASLLPPLSAAPSASTPTANPALWRGFNLLEKFTLRGNAPYRESDFQWMAELGFNFARLPMDYRCYTDPDDWTRFKEPVLKEIDQAVEFGERHRVHVSLNLHRAPGFCINPPAEPTNLWTDSAALEAFVAHWVMFAERYRHVPPHQLSFNLLNEPTRNTRGDFLKVCSRAIEAIHRVDPNRPVIVDGNNVGKDPTPEFSHYRNVIQATRGYHPGTVSHYRASWVGGSDAWPEPTWPPLTLHGHLYGPSKPELRSPLRLEGQFPAGTTLTLEWVRLSVKAQLEARADNALITTATFDPRTTPDAWTPIQSTSGWTHHEPTSPVHFRLTLPAPARVITIDNVDGDWILFNTLTLALAGQEPRAHRADASWGQRHAPLIVTDHGRLQPPPGTPVTQTLIDYLAPWRELAAQGVPVFVGEWGCYNKTPHPVALGWMQAWLELWQEAGFGWALWNFRGSFGILDSGRADVPYESWRGHQLDRQMLELLQRYPAANPRSPTQ
jgi:hypothetical protein